MCARHRHPSLESGCQVLSIISEFQPAVSMLGTAATKSQDSGFGDREVVTHMVSLENRCRRGLAPYQCPPHPPSCRENLASQEMLFLRSIACFLFNEEILLCSEAQACVGKG